MKIPVYVTNRYAVLKEGISEELYDKMRLFWSYAPKGLWFMPRYRPTKILKGQRVETVTQIMRLEKKVPQPAAKIRMLRDAVAEIDERLKWMWDGKIRLLKRGRISAGLFRATWKDAEKALGIEFDWMRERRDVELAPGLPPAGEKYRHQDACVANMLTTLPRGGGIVLAATSSGKTAIAARLFAKTKCPCLFVVDQLDLLYQQQAELREWLDEEIGFVGNSAFKPQRVTVATIQTLNLHRNREDFKKWYSTIDVMVVDELHEQLAKRNFDVLEAIEPVAIYGLTATLQMRNKETRMRAFSFAGPVIFRFPISEGVKRGVLAKGHALQLLFTEEGVPDNATYLDELEIQVLANPIKMEACHELMRLLVKRLGRHAVVLTERVQHLKDVSDRLSDVPHGLAYGDVDIEDRQEVKKQFEAEEIRAIVTNRVFKKGVSIKRIDAMIDLAEGKSKNDPVQKYGRGLRLHPDKSELMYIDFGTSSGRFARNAASRRKALRDAGIDVMVAKVWSTDQAVGALKKFMKKVGIDRGNNSNRPKDTSQLSISYDQLDQGQTVKS